jgi:hypothetical protein
MHRSEQRQTFGRFVALSRWRRLLNDDCPIAGNAQQCFARPAVYLQSLIELAGLHHRARITVGIKLEGFGLLAVLPRQRCSQERRSLRPEFYRNKRKHFVSTLQACEVAWAAYLVLVDHQARKLALRFHRTTCSAELLFRHRAIENDVQFVDLAVGDELGPAHAVPTQLNETSADVARRLANFGFFAAYLFASTAGYAA